MRIRLPILIDVFLTSDPDEIRWLNAHPAVVRPPDDSAGLLHRLVNGRTLRDLAFDGEPLPVFRPKADAERARRQRELADLLDEPERVAEGDTEWLGRYVTNAVAAGDAGDAAPASEASDDLVGVKVQHWCGRLFTPRFAATLETYAAGRFVAQWPTVLPWRARKLREQREAAKRDLAHAANHDIHCIHAASIGTENITRSVRNMRELADRVGASKRSAEEAMRQCLVVPPVLIRGCEREVSAPFLRKPLQSRTLVFFLLARAYHKSADLDLAFLDGTWSACPARHVVPEMLRSVWKSAVALEAQRNSGWHRIRRATNVARQLLRVVDNR